MESLIAQESMKADLTKEYYTSVIVEQPRESIIEQRIELKEVHQNASNQCVCRAAYKPRIEIIEKKEVRRAVSRERKSIPFVAQPSKFAAMYECHLKKS